jgi:hypothetical protein
MLAMRAEGSGGYQDLKLVDIPKPSSSEERILARNGSLTTLGCSAGRDHDGCNRPRLERHERQDLLLFYETVSARMDAWSGYFSVIRIRLDQGHRCEVVYS